jgi:RNA polymerase sigma-70 factor (ECF subfamily)
VAALTQRFGADQLELIESCLHEAQLRGRERWASGELPPYAGSWIVRLAHDLALAELRRQQRHDDSGVFDASLLRDEQDELPVELATDLDDELQLVLLCCHPALGREASVALTLALDCGFSAQQIAQAFSTSEEIIAQRLTSAKQCLREAGASLERSPADALPALLEVLWLLFDQGYSPSDGSAAIKGELCREALRLSRTLAQMPWAATPASHALHALLCLQASRSPARLGEDGSLRPLAEQDRKRWEGGLIAEGFESLTRAADGVELSRFQLEAGIAACHAAAPSYPATDWAQLVFLYDELRRIHPSPMVEIERAVAIAMQGGAQAGLDELDAIPERSLIESYPQALSAYAELHSSLGHLDQARAYLDRALARPGSQAERLFLQRKRAALEL